MACEIPGCAQDDTPRCLTIVKARPPFAAHVQMLQMLAWGFFIAASAAMLVVVPLEIGEAQANEFIRNQGLRSAALWLLEHLDALWITLAAVNTYLFVAEAEGIGTARRWAGSIILGSAALVWIEARTGFPFGPIHFTDNLGARIGGTLPF